MLFMLPLVDPDTYMEDQLLYSNALALMVYHYDLQASWFAYRKTVEIT